MPTATQQKYEFSNTIPPFFLTPTPQNNNLLQIQRKKNTLNFVWQKKITDHKIFLELMLNFP